MGTFVKRGAAAVAVAALALACADRTRPPPRGPEPAPQRAFNDPVAQAPVDPLANHRTPRPPLSEPSPQAPALEPPTAQTPIEQPRPQEPFYGPGLKAPDDRVLAKTAAPLSDAQVIGAVVAANEGEVQMAKLAVDRATAPDVKAFAGLMKSQHQAELEKAKAVEKKTKIPSADSDVSSYLRSGAEAATKDLRDEKGRSFDRAYVDSQVKAHEEALTAIDDRLVPSARNGEVKTMLVEMRRMVADHLEKAEDLQRKVDRAVSSSDVTR